MGILSYNLILLLEYFNLTDIVYFGNVLILYYRICNVVQAEVRIMGAAILFQRMFTFPSSSVIVDTT